MLDSNVCNGHRTKARLLSMLHGGWFESNLTQVRLLFHDDHRLWCWEIQQRYLETVVYCKFPAEPLPLVLGDAATVSGYRGVLQVPCGTIASGAGICNNCI